MFRDRTDRGLEDVRALAIGRGIGYETVRAGLAQLVEQPPCKR